MCGIVGYAGSRDTVEVLLEGLRRLEYRGYDSAGLALVSEHGLSVTKAQGKVVALAALLDSSRPEAAAGIAHTRWATHGPPSSRNAHPHTDCGGLLAVVHNGIIENYLELKQQLEAAGHRFRSQTDTEVLAHLFEHHYKGDLHAAMRRGLRSARGSYAVAAISSQEPEVIVAARHHSPLIAGLGEQPGENFLASDLSALLPYTRKAYLLDEDEFVRVTAKTLEISTLSGKQVTRPIFHIPWEAARAAKDGHKHFMLKEILEQPQALRATLEGRLNHKGRPRLEGLNLRDSFLRKVKRVVIIACGTAAHAGLVGRAAIEQLCGLPVIVDVASELQYREVIFDNNTLGIAISQSGETADTLQALRKAQARGTKVLAITNVVGSSVAREADGLLALQAGPEIGVASTKAYTCQLTALLLVALYLGQVRGTLSEAAGRRFTRELRKLPELAAETLQSSARIRRLAAKYREARRYLYLGRGPHHATALEGALKLKELAYLDAEGYAAGEMKHGPLALVEQGVPVLAVVIPGPHYEKMLGNLQEVRARGGIVIAVGPSGDDRLTTGADHVLPLPQTPELLSPVLAAIPLQLYAYHLSDLLGREIDQPRNLAKSVTVE